ncbi:hypothetical protein V6Z12_D06G159200 [Gossypium hirsutum]
MLVRWKRNKVEDLMVYNEWCFEEDVLKQHVVQFFKELYTMDYVTNGVFPCRGKFPMFCCNEMMTLISVVSDEEIHRAMFSMAPLKVPGVDGFQASFFQTQWEIVGPSVCSFVRHSLGGLRLDPKLNRTLLILIPKTPNPERINQFWLISLCSVLYKILTKRIVNRMRLLMVKLISQNQSNLFQTEILLIIL